MIVLLSLELVSFTAHRLAAIDDDARELWLTIACNPCPLVPELE